MPNWKYSVSLLDTAKTAKASGRDLRISHKASREICLAIRHMKLDDAHRFLEGVIAKKSVVPYRRYKKKVGHKRGLQGWYAGRYPVKASRAILQILDSVEANASFKGLNVESLKIIHSAALKARKIRGFTPRAFGRASPSFDQLTHIEIAVEEVS